MVGVRFERIQGCDRHIAPISNRSNHRPVRSSFQDIDMLITIGPRRPVVRNEICEHDAIAADCAVLYRRRVDDRAPWDAVRYGGFDGDGKGELLVDDRDVARRSRFAVEDGSGTDDHANRRLERRPRREKNREQRQNYCLRQWFSRARCAPNLSHPNTPAPIRAIICGVT